MRLRKGSYEMDMTSGAILPKLLLFALPLMLSSILQLLFNAADVVVVGRFDGANALAAVGSTGALINLIVNLFVGMSIGTNVVIARHYGAGKYKEASEAVHTSIAISLGGGIFLAVFGTLMSGTFLSWMGSPEEVLPLATVYMRIYFLGMPFNMLYNFGAAILRSIGDTRRPLVYLTISGVVNVLLNLFFIIVLHMGVAGVALATIISQAISALLVLLCLLRSSGIVHVDLRKIRIHPREMASIARIGLPAGVQSMFFSISNVLIQSTINSFGPVAMAGNSVSANIEGFIYVAMNAMHQAAVTFTSQNTGARMYRRIRKICLISCAAVSVIGFVIGVTLLAMGNILMGIYSTDPAVVAAGAIRLNIFGFTYFTCGIMEVLCGVMRGLGSTIKPMLISLSGACLFRIFWIYCILPFDRTMHTLYVSYPVSWILTTIIYIIFLIPLLRKFPVHAGADASEAA